MPSRTIIEAVLIDFTSSRSRKSQHYCSASWSGWHRSNSYNADGTWCYKPVIVHETTIRLVIGEGRTVSVGVGGAVDDEWDATIERVG